MNTNNPANLGKVVVFNDRAGILTVRATSQDLDLIEAAMQTLNHAPPEINIKAKFIEITQNDVKGLGFNWNIGGFKIGQGVVAQGGTQPSLNGTSTSVNPGGVFPTSATAAALSDGNVTAGLRNTFGPQLAGTLPTVATVTGILTEPQFRATIAALDQRDGTDELNATEVTTESGRQAQMQAVDIVTIVTGTTTTTGTGAGTPTPAGTGTIIATAAAPAVNYPTSTYPLGPTLDVIPYVSADEYSVQMTLIPTVTEFVGYDDPGQFVPQAVAAGSGGANLSVTATLPLPHFRAREVVTSVTVWDSQTVVLGGLITDVVTKVKDQVPMLGSLPLIGRLFQSQSASKTKKNLMIFVTPTIINPDGTRYHSDDEMPFNQAFAPVAKPMSTP
jgi:general secretion pathway protein D